MSADNPGPVTRLVDIVFPGDTNHHGTLFGGVGLSHMDKVAFIAASRHGRVDFVTASCERIDFAAPARLGEIVELTGRLVRVGRRSVSAAVELHAEALLTGERRLCTRGVFNMVAVGVEAGATLPPLQPDGGDDGVFRMVEMVFPQQLSHYGTLYGGNALAAMGKAAFITATRHARKPIVMAATREVNFTHAIGQGEVMELVPRVEATGRSSMTIAIDLWSEDLLAGTRRLCGQGSFVMVAVDENQRPVPIDG
ncbi:acyl-CoA thioesterase [Chelatococcus asaccharovorans]|uniref:Acyl-CoA hydrolase n=1 Tax=Chelatococcus asaccharovorans TaxID=28210 RepID=A0A2V3UJ85_9HYPH|nr:acyl-CoA thioesterase [Chelatococcus asaccharovorans]MBS7706026.1 acyl-CoA thioesterase [Chelatococcus asaccharovorans]PXW59048.1 acyl-CoA hydrolase [Chelatococcus asaccharovorans]CAH1659564.1 Acyl-CoA hydrolase [Chelatococcus asaccharovorans]CAH1684141.1 Acyl-CoA hydrolase [Chelatococcus asaccharovorans]